MKRKICIVTGTRAEYGLLRWLIDLIHNDDEILLQLVVTGMHLSPEFGLTYKQIEKDGYPILRKVETLLSSDSSVGVSKAVGLGVISFSEVFNELNPDILIVLGDRFEIFAAVSATIFSPIIIAHIHGGESTLGAFDEKIRHAISKMSHIHFTATETYRNRVIQLGEHPDRVFNSGSPAMDNISNFKLLSKKAFEKAINFSLKEKIVLVTFHPTTLDYGSAEFQISELLMALDSFKELKIIFTYPNADSEGRIIKENILKFVKNNKIKSIAFSSLGQLNYLSALQFVDLVIGNSSSGIIEAPSFKVPTINIGDRQEGRIKASSIIDTPPKKDSIVKAINLALSESFQTELKEVQNPYGKKGSSKNIFEILRHIELKSLLKKEFYDLK